jgi:hypothetical protein
MLSDRCIIDGMGNMLIARFDTDLLLGEGPDMVCILPDSEIKTLKLESGQYSYEIGCNFKAFFLVEAISSVGAFVQYEGLFYYLFVDRLGLDLELDGVFIKNGVVTMAWRCYGAIALVANVDERRVGLLTYVCGEWTQ